MSKTELRLGEHMYGFGAIDETIGDNDTEVGYKMAEGRFDQHKFNEVLAVVRSRGVTRWVRVRRKNKEPITSAMAFAVGYRSEDGPYVLHYDDGRTSGSGKSGKVLQPPSRNH